MGGLPPSSSVPLICRKRPLVRNFVVAWLPMARIVDMSTAMPMIVAAVFVAALQPVAPPPVPIVRTAASSMLLDGRIDEPAWQGAPVVPINYQIQPGDNVPASEPTEVRLLYTDRALWIGIRAWVTEPTSLRARVGRRDDIATDDHILISLDTDSARQRAFRFQVNPLGIQADALYTTAGGDDYSWDGVFSSRGRVTADGYMIELSIPFQTLRFTTAPSMTWGLQIERWIPHRAERTSWTPISRDNASVLGQMGTITGLSGITRSHGLDITPAVTAAVGQERPTAAVGLARASRRDLGVTTVYGVTSGMALSATINPDFSQVEADDPQVTVNQRFNISFAEKRPFFLEGAEYFQSTVPSGLRLLDTRSIVAPDWGVKLTGRVGRNALGFLAASDAAPTGDNALIGAARYQRDLFADSALGLSVVSRKDNGRTNTVGSGELRFRWRKVTTLGLQAAASSPEQMQSTITGRAYRLASTTRGRAWRIFLWDEFVSSTFEARSGAVPVSAPTGGSRHVTSVRPDGQAPDARWSHITCQQPHRTMVHAEPAVAAVLHSEPEPLGATEGLGAGHQAH